ncbi:MAG: RNA methyltransferase [Actinobacteria bacterium]|nr:RNA methyltransferase [Actinomycetota bacterium]
MGRLPTGDPAGLSFRHQRVQRVRRLLRSHSARQAERAFVLEGEKLLAEAVNAGVSVESVYLAPGAAVPDELLGRAARVFDLAPGVMERVADTVTPQPVLSVVPYVDVGPDVLGTATFVVVCIDLRDPGNAGTVLRSAEAAGAEGVIFCVGAVDVYNPKTVRASAGSLFHVPVVVGGEPVSVVQALGQQGLRTLGAVAHGGVDYTATDLAAPVALVVGNEAHGLPADVTAALDACVTIPMAGRGESLNAGMATAVLCFEVARQRRERT